MKDVVQPLPAEDTPREAEPRVGPLLPCTGEKHRWTKRPKEGFVLPQLACTVCRRWLSQLRRDALVVEPGIHRADPAA